MLAQATKMGAQLVENGVTGFASPVVGNVGVEMGNNVLTQYRAQRGVRSVLNLDMTQYPPC